MRLAPLTAVAALFAVSSLTSSAFAKDFYVDPVKGAKTGDGSAEKPWKTLEEVVADKLIQSQQWESYPYAEGKKLVVKNAGAPVKAGDTIYLLDGYHGAPTLAGYYNESVLTIAAAPGAKPKLGKLAFTSGKNWKLVGLSISPANLPTWSNATMFAVEAGGGQGPISDVVIEGCFLEGPGDALAATWTKEDWDTKSPSGLSVRGARVTVRKTHLHNVNFGIVLGGEATDGLVEGNVVDTFSGDGMRGLGDREVFQGTVVKNALQVNDNHSDGFQSWSVGADKKVGTGEVTGIVLRGNLFLNKEKIDLPFAAGMQGIGCFDGTYVDFVIENNVVISDTYHGISLYGSRNARIVNNTVLRRDATQKPVPWVGIFDHKNGTKPINALVRNNLTAALSLVAMGVTEDHNPKVEDADWPALFVDAPKLDFHLKPGASAIDAGVADKAPANDFDGIPRPQGKGIDLGAFEQHEGSVMPVGGSGGTGGTSGVGGSGGTGGTSSSGGGGGTSSGGGGGAAGSGAAGSGTAGTSAGAGTGGASTSGGSGGTISQAAGSSGTGASGQSVGKGGATTGSGASAGAPSSNAGASGAAASGPLDAAGDEDGGCGCRAAVTAPVPFAWSAGGLVLGLVALIRRRLADKLQVVEGIGLPFGSVCSHAKTVLDEEVHFVVASHLHLSGCRVAPQAPPAHWNFGIVKSHCDAGTK